MGRSRRRVFLRLALWCAAFFCVQFGVFAAAQDSARPPSASPPPAPPPTPPPFSASDQHTALLGLMWLAALLVLGSGGLLLAAQRATAKALAQAADKSVLAQMPLAVPEGTIRALISIVVVILGLSALILQWPLGLQRTDTIVGFVSIVITFYFATRNDQSARQTIKDATEAISDSSKALSASIDQVSKTSEHLMRTANFSAPLQPVAFRAEWTAAAGGAAAPTIYDVLHFVEDAVHSVFDQSRIEFDRTKTLDDLTGMDADGFSHIVDSIYRTLIARPELQPYAPKINNFAHDIADACIGGTVIGLIDAIVRKIMKAIS